MLYTLCVKYCLTRIISGKIMYTILCCIQCILLCYILKFYGTAYSYITIYSTLRPACITIYSGFSINDLIINFSFQQNERVPWNYCKKQNLFTLNRKQYSTGNKSSEEVSGAAVLPTRVRRRTTSLPVVFTIKVRRNTFYSLHRTKNNTTKLNKKCL